MNSSDDIHDMTETIYKNLSEQFTPAVRQLLTCAKVYHKALLAASTAARSYIESLGRLGHHCRNACQGGTEQIGEAIFRIAEIQKEVQLKFEDCNKALFAEVVIPMEQKLDNDFKNAAAEQKKYHGGHKSFLVPYTKAAEAHRKFMKKHSRARQVYDEEKETLLRRTMERCRNKLDEYRLQGLKLALLEERRCYCFVLARLSSVATIQLYYHGRGADLLKAEVGGWKQLCSQPNILPRSADPLLHVMGPCCQDTTAYQDSSSTTYTVYSPNEAGHSPYRHITSPVDMQPTDYAQPVSSSDSSDTLSRSIATTINMTQVPGGRPPPGPPGGEETMGLQVRALYSHPGGPGSQLAFTTGDLLTLMGDPADGWQFGQNARSGQYGWFPLSFTGDVPDTRRQIQTPMRYRQRAKSFSDLNGDVRSLSDLREWTPDLYNVPGSQLRPRSLYDPSPSLITAAPSMPQLLAHAPVEGTRFSIPTNPSLMPAAPSSTLLILGTRSQPASRAPSPPLPPPPPQFMHMSGGMPPSSVVGPGIPQSLFRHPGMRSVHHTPTHLLPMAARLPPSFSHQHIPTGVAGGPPSYASQPPPPPSHPPPAAPSIPRPPLPNGGGGGGGGSQLASALASSHNVVVQSHSPQGQSRAASPQPTSLEASGHGGAEVYHAASEGVQPPAPPAPPPAPPPPPPPTG